MEYWKDYYSGGFWGRKEEKHPDDDVPMWTLRNRRHEDETMDDQPSWEPKPSLEGLLTQFESTAESIRKMREESERMRESTEKAEWMTQFTIQSQVSCPNFEVNSDSNEEFLFGQDSYPRKEEKDTWLGDDIEPTLQEDDQTEAPNEEESSPQVSTDDCAIKFVKEEDFL